MPYRNMVRNSPEVFSAVTEAYDEARPGYPAELYKTVGDLCRLGGESSILEVGAGTGAATEEILAAWNPRLTLLEPGEGLYRVLESRYGGSGKVTVARARFEDYAAGEAFDAVLSATAFHWIDRKLKFRLARRALKDGGFLILFWNNYSRDDNPLFDEIQSVYRRFYPVKTYNNDIRIVQRKAIDDRVREVERSSLFEIVRRGEYVSRRWFSASAYVVLLKTFSKNAARPPEIMEKFYREMEALLARRGGGLDLPIRTDLIVARVRSR